MSPSNREGRYATWNSLCCGVEDDLLFEGVYLAGTKLDFGIDFIFSDNRFVPIVTNGTLLIGEKFSIGR